MPDFVLVFEMCDDLGFAGQCPNETSTVGSGNPLRWAEADDGLMYVAGGLVHAFHKKLHELVHHVLVQVVCLVQGKGVVEEDVGWKKCDVDFRIILLPIASQ